MSGIERKILIAFVVLFTLGFVFQSSYAAIDPNTIVAAYTFEEGVGEEVRDISGNGNDGMFLGNPKWVDGKFGTALDFKSLGDVVHIPEFGLVAPQKEATITFWTELGDTQDCDILSFDPLDGANRITIHFPWGNGVVWQHGTDQHVAAGGMPKETLNNWEFWAFIGSTRGNYMRILRNMEEFDLREDTATAKPAFVASEQTWSIGGRQGSSYTGIINEVGVFEAALSDEDLTEIMENGLEITAFAVHPSEKMTTTWGKIKRKN